MTGPTRTNWARAIVAVVLLLVAGRMWLSRRQEAARETGVKRPPPMAGILPAAAAEEEEAGGSRLNAYGMSAAEEALFMKEREAVYAERRERVARICTTMKRVKTSQPASVTS